MLDRIHDRGEIKFVNQSRSHLMTQSPTLLTLIILTMNLRKLTPLLFGEGVWHIQGSYKHTLYVFLEFALLFVIGLMYAYLTVNYLYGSYLHWRSHI
ncbi:uncharacterized protein LOC132053593 isoform X2 [Lycium ferocissimum]|nr:uncharacterized protein LOC132053593 isoform X2 [Lycium ferocissimum]XP_059301661.1 uncharacterized protein LOC132053593 isoform X2 [Lycium ferocissimum]